jgi:hypothetical protein
VEWSRPDDIHLPGLLDSAQGIAHPFLVQLAGEHDITIIKHKGLSSP